MDSVAASGSHVPPVVHTTTGGRGIRALYLTALVVFVFSTLFDPADSIFGLKVPLYVLCWFLGILYSFSLPGGIRVRSGLLLFAVLMVAIPLVSIGLYFLLDGSEPFDGFLMFKAYVFISMSLLLYITRTNLLPYLSAALSVLAVAVLFVGSLVLLQPALLPPLYAFGRYYDVFHIAFRDYGGLVLFQMYFVTSPMLAISAAYYFDRAVKVRERRVRYGLATLLSILGLIMAGTRNNLLAAVILPLALYFMHARKKVLVGSIIALVVLVALAAVSEQLSIMLDPQEVSNRTKLVTLLDYGTILSDPITILFGRGLGSYEYWTGRGFNSVTELSYLEVFRNFGVIMGAIVILLLVYPIVHAFALRRSYPEKSVMMGYLAYLVMCASNPNLFSSMGILILCVVTANIAMYEARRSAPFGMVPGTVDG